MLQKFVEYLNLKGLSKNMVLASQLLEIDTQRNTVVAVKLSTYDCLPSAIRCYSYISR